jgi:hypothetical protein
MPAGEELFPAFGAFGGVGYLRWTGTGHTPSRVFIWLQIWTFFETISGTTEQHSPRCGMSSGLPPCWERSLRCAPQLEVRFRAEGVRK